MDELEIEYNDMLVHNNIRWDVPCEIFTFSEYIHFFLSIFSNPNDCMFNFLSSLAFIADILYRSLKRKDQNEC